MSNRLTRIYTRTGDDGRTALADGHRISKDHPRIRAIGETDILNSQLGLLLTELDDLPGNAMATLKQTLADSQHRLFDLGGQLATPDYRAVRQEDVDRLEQAIDACNAELAPLKDFILPAGSRAVAQAHVCRAAARAAERALWALAEIETVEQIMGRYLNRLSDLLFVAARTIGQAQGIPEVLWSARQACH